MAIEFGERYSYGIDPEKWASTVESLNSRARKDGLDGAVISETIDGIDPQTRNPISISAYHPKHSSFAEKESEMLHALGPDIAPTVLKTTRMPSTNGMQIPVVVTERIVPLTEDPRDENQMILAVCAAAVPLDALHRRGVIHQNIRPESIVFGIRRNEERVLIRDFGLARVNHPKALGHNETVRKRLFDVANPNALNQDPRSDVFNLGMVAYWACTGEYTYPTFKPEHMDEEVWWTIRIATKPNPSIRYSTCIEFANDLQEAVKGK